MLKIYTSFIEFCSSIVAPLANLAARIYMGYYVFFVSGLAKLDDFETTIELFEDDWVIPFLPAVPAAYLATIGELVLPVLLIAGLMTRISALGLFIMTLVIQVYAVQDPQHFIWMLVFGLLVSYGGDRISVDYWLNRKSSKT